MKIITSCMLHKFKKYLCEALFEKMEQKTNLPIESDATKGCKYWYQMDSIITCKSCNILFPSGKFLWSARIHNVCRGSSTLCRVHKTGTKWSYLKYLKGHWLTGGETPVGGSKGPHHFGFSLPSSKKFPLYPVLFDFLQNEHSGTQNKINLKWSNWSDNTSPLL